MTRKNKRQSNESADIIFKDVKPQTRNQNDFFRSVAENDITICHGPAGTGKTLCSVALAIEHYFSQRVSRILLSKSIIGCDNEIGLLPGGIDEKTHIYMQSFYEYLADIIPNMGRVETLIYNENILLEPIEVLRGRTYHNTFMILDEAQNCTPRQLKMFMSRMGKNSKLVIVGDPKQSDIKYDGLSFLLSKLPKQGMQNVGIVELTNEDILRNGLVGKILRIFDENGY